MNEWLNRLILQAKIKTIGWHRWRKILSANGVVKAGALSEKQLDEIILKIFKSFFKESKKDKPIKLEQLGKTYENGYKAVHNFSLDVDPGDFVCLLGPSGCGKTTALRMIAGLDNITEGKYFLGNKEMNSIHPSERKTAMVFQNYALYPFMTVYNNIAFGLKLKITKNDLVSHYIKQILIDKYPNYEKIQDAKFALWEAKHPFHYEINAAKIKVKKASFKEFKKEELDSAKRELKKFQDLANEQKGDSKHLAKIKQTILKLKKEQKILISQQKTELQKQEKTIKNQIANLLQKQDEYKDKKRGMIPVINETISKLETEKSDLTKKYSEEFKKYSVFARKKVTNQEEFEQIKTNIKTFELSIEEKETKIQYEKNKIIAINNSKAAEIKELKHKLNSSKIIKQKILDSAIIWKYSIPARIRELSELVGIRNFLKRKPSALSGGQRQRVALIRAISKDAQLFLFDEPLSNLDAKLRGVMRSEIRKIHDRIGSTSLYVTHDQIEAMTMANKVVIMNVGYIQQVGSPKDLYDNPSNVFVARFIGTPTINMMRGIMKDVSTFTSANSSIPVDFNKEQKTKLKAYKGKEVILGIRPHHVKVCVGARTPKNAIEGIVETFELVGSEYVLKVETKNLGNVRIQVPASMKVEKNQSIKFTFEKEHAFIFDAKTGVSITSKINEETQAALDVWTESARERISNKIILESERDQTTLGKKVSEEVKSMFDKKYKMGLIHKKVEKNNKKTEDYNLVETDNDNNNVINS